MENINNGLQYFSKSEKQQINEEIEMMAYGLNRGDINWHNQVKEFKQEYPNVDLDELAKSNYFIKFVKGRKLDTLSRTYKKFLVFMKECNLV